MNVVHGMSNNMQVYTFFHLLYMQGLIVFYATEISFQLVFMCLTTNCLSLSLIKCTLNNTQL